MDHVFETVASVVALALAAFVIPYLREKAREANARFEGSQICARADLDRLLTAREARVRQLAHDEWEDWYDSNLPRLAAGVLAGKRDAASIEHELNNAADAVERQVRHALGDDPPRSTLTLIRRERRKASPSYPRPLAIWLTESGGDRARRWARPEDRGESPASPC